MDVSENNQDREQELSGSTQTSETVSQCCIETLKIHATHNPMMVCTHCKQIIKCFKEEKAYRNYLKFCQSRHRKVTTGLINGMHTVVFRSYESYR